MQFAPFLDRVLTPLLVFVGVYIASFILFGWLEFPLVQWAGLICVTIATVVTIGWVEKGRWDLGLFTRTAVAAREFATGSAFGCVLVGVCALLVASSTDLSHARGIGFPWIESMTIFIPAVLHEELLFRGYPLQKLMRWNRGIALVFVAAVFAALHGGNTSISALGLTNIFLGGILLGLAYERHRRLWLPIGIHLAWNFMSGPILGHEVSGYLPARTLFVEVGDGPVWLTGGDFGIEGSIWMTFAEVVGIVLLATRIRPARSEYDSAGSRSDRETKEREL